MATVAVQCMHAAVVFLVGDEPRGLRCWSRNWLWRSRNWRLRKSVHGVVDGGVPDGAGVDVRIGVRGIVDGGIPDGAGVDSLPSKSSFRFFLTLPLPLSKNDSHGMSNSNFAYVSSDQAEHLFDISSNLRRTSFDIFFSRKRSKSIFNLFQFPFFQKNLFPYFAENTF